MQRAKQVLSWMSPCWKIDDTRIKKQALQMMRKANYSGFGAHWRLSCKPAFRADKIWKAARTFSSKYGRLQSHLTAYNGLYNMAKYQRSTWRRMAPLWGWICFQIGKASESSCHTDAGISNMFESGGHNWQMNLKHSLIGGIVTGFCDLSRQLWRVSRVIIDRSQKSTKIVIVLK